MKNKKTGMYVIAGNHDIYCQNNYATIYNLLKDNQITLLNNQLIYIDINVNNIENIINIYNQINNEKQNQKQSQIENKNKNQTKCNNKNCNQCLESLQQLNVKNISIFNDEKNISQKCNINHKNNINDINDIDYITQTNVSLNECECMVHKHKSNNDKNENENENENENQNENNNKIKTIKLSVFGSPMSFYRGKPSNAFQIHRKGEDESLWAMDERNDFNSLKIYDTDYIRTYFPNADTVFFNLCFLFLFIFFF